MSNNGRRRWRKWARLIKMGRDSNARFEVFRRHRDTTFMGCELCPPPLPVKTGGVFPARVREVPHV